MSTSKTTPTSSTAKPTQKYKVSNNTLKRVFDKDGGIYFRAAIEESTLFRLTHFQSTLNQRREAYIEQFKSFFEQYLSFIERKNDIPQDTIEIPINSKLKITLIRGNEHITIQTRQTHWYGGHTSFTFCMRESELTSHISAQKSNLEKNSTFSFFNERIAAQEHKFNLKNGNFNLNNQFHILALGSGIRKSSSNSMLNTVAKHMAKSSNILHLNGPSARLGKGFDNNVREGVKNILLHIWQHKNQEKITINLSGHSRGGSECVAIYNEVNRILKNKKLPPWINAVEQNKMLNEMLNTTTNLPKISYRLFLMDPVRGPFKSVFNQKSAAAHIQSPVDGSEVFVHLIHSNINESWSLANTSAYNSSRLVVKNPENTHLKVDVVACYHQHLDQFNQSQTDVKFFQLNQSKPQPTDARGENQRVWELLKSFFAIEAIDNIPLVYPPRDKNQWISLQAALREAQTRNKTLKRAEVSRLYGKT